MVELSLQQAAMTQRTLQRRLHLHLPELSNGEVQVRGGLTVDLKTRTFAANFGKMPNI